MSNKAQLIYSKIYHQRLFPRDNKFSYGMSYLALPLSKLDTLNIWPLFGVNRPGLMSFWNKDHGDRTGSDLAVWARRLLIANGIDDADGEIVLVALPRLFGYVFNPVSFWMCYRSNGELRAVIAEVNNTFGETHSYVCAPESGEGISSQNQFYAEKDFHVSPFLTRSGYYRFNFNAGLRDTRSGTPLFSVRIDYFDSKSRLQLRTSVAGPCVDWSRKNLLIGWFRSPLLAVKASALIHWQAVKLLFKSVGYQPKPVAHQWVQTRATQTPMIQPQIKRDEYNYFDNNFNTLAQEEYIHVFETR